MRLARVVSARDRSELLGMDAACFPGEDPPEIEGARCWWLVWMRGEPVAYAGLKFLANERAAFLERAGVLAKARGKGLHRRLIRARVLAAKRAGMRYAITYTTHDNYPSMNNLVAEGFRFYEPEWAWAGREFHYFRRELQ